VTPKVFAMNVVLVTILLRTQEQILVAIHALMVLLVLQEPMILPRAFKKPDHALAIVNAFQEQIGRAHV
jgi:hypothetical protein